MARAFDLGLPDRFRIGDRLRGTFKEAPVVLGPNRIAMLIVCILWTKRITAQELIAQVHRLDVWALGKRWRKVCAIVRLEREEHGEEQDAATQHHSGTQKERTCHLIPHRGALNFR